MRVFELKSIDDRFRSSSYIAYGFKDKVFKYGIDGRYFLSYNPRLKIGLVYSKDFEQLGNNIFSTGIFIDNRPSVNHNFISRGENFYLTAVEMFGFNSQIEPSENLYMGISLTSKHFAS